MTKLIWFDTEGTGLDPVKNDIIQIAGIIIIDGAVKDEFEFKCRPHDPDNIEPEAIEVHGFTKKEFMSWPSPIVVYKEITRIFSKYINQYNPKDKFTPFGQNISFDINMLSSFFNKCGDDYFGSWMTRTGVDTLTLASLCKAMGLIQVKNLKLSTLADYFGVGIKAHDALSDIQATRAIGLKLLELINNNKIKV